MNILVDIDGTLFDPSRAFDRILRQKYGLRNIDIYVYNLGELLGVSQSVTNDILSDALNNGPLMLEEYCLLALKKLNEGHKIVFGTSRDVHVSKVKTKELLKKNGLMVEKMLFSEDLENIKQGEFDVVIDDSISKLVRFSNYVKYIIIFNRPWNIRCLNVQGFYRVNSWLDIWERIRMLEVQNGR